MGNLILIALIPVVGAFIFIGLMIYRMRMKKINQNEPAPAKDLDPEQVDEITSTWNLLNH